MKNVYLAISLLVVSYLSPILVAGQKPFKVFILAGQSNMQGHAQVSTFEHIGMDPKTAPLLAKMQDESGTPVVCEDVWISSIGSSEGEKYGQLTAGYGAEQRGPKIGPEFTFGIFMQEKFGEPILIIKTAWGGKSLHTDFRPPSAGAYEFGDQQIENLQKRGKDIQAIRDEKEQATGHYYRLMLEHVNGVLSDIQRVYPKYDSTDGFELAGFVWFQGWNDMVDSGTYPNRDKPGGYDQYSEVMAHFIRDVRKELAAPELPFVIGVMGVGGPVENYGPERKRHVATHTNFRDAMAAPATLPEFKGNVSAVLTERYWDQELSALVARDSGIKQRIKKLKSEDKLTRENELATLEELRAEEFSDREREILEKGVSNAEYHYLGSAKIMAGIGQGFAEALEER